MRRAKEKWLPWAKFPSAAITAAWMRRLCLLFLPTHITAALRIKSFYGACGPTWNWRSSGLISSEILMGTALSSMHDTRATV